MGALNKKKERIRAEKEVQEKEKLRQAELDERIENHRDLFLQTKAYYQQGGLKLALNYVIFQKRRVNMLEISINNIKNRQ